MKQPVDLAEARRVYPPIYTVYYRPRDFPDNVVIRMWYGPDFPLPCVCLLDTVEEARTMLENEGLYCLGRQPDDDSAILESWV